MKTLNLRQHLLGAFAVMQSVILTGCSQQTVIINEAETPASAYCSTVTSYSGSTITVSGNAYYAPRKEGNLEVQDGGYRYRPTAAIVVGQTYSLTFAGTTYSKVAVVSDTQSSLAQNLVNQINSNANAPVTAQFLTLQPGNQYYVLVNQKNYSNPWIVARSKSANITETARDLPSPVRFAEIMVRDSSGNIIQCGSTNNSGAYSLTLPLAASGSYTVQVNSRVNDALKARAYVLDYHLTNAHYTISKSVFATSSTSNNNLLASGEGTAIAGAFNILDQIIKSNEFLATHVSTNQLCGTITYPECVPFTAAPLVTAYWKKGVNPYTYWGVSSPSSFYVGNSRLYILGGIDGDVDNSDTDHFDNSVIVHEYGHFLEDIYATSDSPGGSHNANSIIDPRLAWSEGWADFLQGAVTGIPFYVDTEGNSSGTSGGNVILDLDLESETRDTPTSGAEGLFREFSVTRLLWDAFDSNSDGADDVTSPRAMTEIWSVFSGTNGLKHPDNPFRHMGTFHKIQAPLPTNWASLRADEFQNGNAAYTNVGLREYGALLTPASCTLNIYPNGDGGTFSTSDQLNNNDFFAYYHPGGSFKVELRYSTVAYSNPPDLDLYVYNSSYTFGNSSTMAGYSQNDRPIGCSGGNPAPCTNVSEIVNASAPAGYYMINVMVYTPGSASGNGGGDATYTLRINNTQMCPSP